MNATRMVCRGVALIIAIAGLAWPAAGRAAPFAVPGMQSLPPVTIADDNFLDFTWTVTEEIIGGGSSTVERRPAGGNPGAFRWMSHRLPPVPNGSLYSVSVTHIYTARYDPRFEGEIRALDYFEDGIILSFPFAEAFSTTQPVVEQGGRIFRSSRFLRFIAQNSSHAWETKGLYQLTAADFVAVDGSGDRPDFTSRGGSLRFGFTRSNSRSSTLPPVPNNQDMVVDQGVDNWRVVVHRDNTNQPPQAVDDVFILDGNNRSLPIYEFLDVADNDSDPNYDRLEVVAVTEPIYGSAGIFSDHTIIYGLDEPRSRDSFGYTISDGALTASAQVDVLIDCACTVLCLNDLESRLNQPADTIDLPLIYRVRDRILEPRLDGRRYVDMYYTNNPEILVTILANEPLRSQAVATVELWQNNLRNLVDGDGRAVITQAQMDAIASFLGNLAMVSSPGLQQLIAGELSRLGPLNSYVGMTVGEAANQALGLPTRFLPLILRS